MGRLKRREASVLTRAPVARAPIQDGALISTRALFSACAFAAGDARIELTISRNGSSDDTKILSLSPANSEARSGNIQIRFVGLTPVPRQADGNSARACVAQLVVNRI
jgi:hypothetical protein